MEAEDMATAMELQMERILKTFFKFKMANQMAARAPGSRVSRLKMKVKWTVKRQMMLWPKVSKDVDFVLVKKFLKFVSSFYLFTHEVFVLRIFRVKCL